MAAEGRAPVALEVLRLLLHEGYEAALRASVLTMSVRERLVWMSKDADGFAHFIGRHFPEGLPDVWLEETGAASWASWYRGRRGGR